MAVGAAQGQLAAQRQAEGIDQDHAHHPPQAQQQKVAGAVEQHRQHGEHQGGRQQTHPHAKHRRDARGRDPAAGEGGGAEGQHGRQRPEQSGRIVHGPGGGHRRQLGQQQAGGDQQQAGQERAGQGLSQQGAGQQRRERLEGREVGHRGQKATQERVGHQQPALGRGEGGQGGTHLRPARQQRRHSHHQLGEEEHVAETDRVLTAHLVLQAELLQPLEHGGIETAQEHVQPQRQRHGRQAQTAQQSRRRVHGYTPAAPLRCGQPQNQELPAQRPPCRSPFTLPPP